MRPKFSFLSVIVIDLPSQSKRYRGSMAGSVDGRGMFTLAETMTEDPSLLDDLRTKDLHVRLPLLLVHRLWHFILNLVSLCLETAGDD